MEALPEHPEEEETTAGEEQETAFNTEQSAPSEQEPLKGRKISTTSTARASGSSSSAPGAGGRRPSRRGSIFVAEEPYSDCLSGYVPEEPDDDVFEVNTTMEPLNSTTTEQLNNNSTTATLLPSTTTEHLNNNRPNGKMKVRGPNDGKFCQRKRIVRLAVMLLLLFGLMLGLIFGLVVENEHKRSAGSEVRDSSGRTGIWSDIRLPQTVKPLKYNVHIRTDLTNFTFNGSVEILIVCTENTHVLLLHCSKLDIVTESVTVRSEHLDNVIHLKRDPWFHEENQYLVIELKSPLKAKYGYKFSAEFSAPLLHDTNAGYYRTSYETSDGKRWTASTLTALTLARRVFPCFDEPSFKANFTLTLDHASDYEAIANMPIEYNTTLTDGWMQSKFQESVPISTYLVAWCITDFGYGETTTQNGVVMRMWARSSALDSVDYSVQVGAKVLDYFDEYFGTKFPLPKLDSIAVPEFPYGGMENWGLISYGPARVLYNEGVSSTYTKEKICTLVAHELAHQWFGNLVTLKWWDDTWLNEGFASFVTYLGANYAEPDWGYNHMFTIRSLYAAMDIDSLSTSRPISLPVATNSEINQQFDIISYKKGASIIRMCSYFLGEDTFRKGLKNYLAEFKYGNADRDDLWKHLNQVSKEAGKHYTDVKKIMDTWTLQMGYPVVTVTRDYGRGDGNLHFRTNQERFLMNPHGNTSTKYGDLGYKWYVPLTYTTSRDARFESPSQEWLSPKSKLTVSITGVGDTEWLFVNVEARGYYRVNYDESNWQLLTQQLIDNHQVIGMTSRSSLINDAFTLARAGFLNQVVALNISQYLTTERDYVPWGTVAEVTGFIGDMLCKSRAYGDFQKYMLHLVTPLYDDIGWNDPGTHMKRQLQSIAIAMACSYGNQQCITEAARQYAEWMQNPSTNPIRPDVKQAVYCSAIRNGGQDEWSFAKNQIQDTNSDTEKRLLQDAMACTQQPWLLQATLTDALDPAVKTDKVLNSVAKTTVGSRMAWDFFWANWDTLRKRYGDAAFYFAGMVKTITTKFNTQYELDQLHSMMTQHPDQGSAERALKQAIESIEANIRWMENNYEEIAEWLSDTVLNLGL